MKIKLTLQQPTISNPNSNPIDNEIEKEFGLILPHFQYLIFPRRVVASELIDGKKYHHFKIVNSKEEALAHFKRYNYVDCRINAFPYLKKGVLWEPELLFIDLDLADFKSKPNPKKSLDLALSKTIKNIKSKLLEDNVNQTIIWSGNGLHIIQPISCPILEGIPEFKKYKSIVPLLSQEFLRFAKDFLSNGKADKNNYPSFDSCYLRIPNSINSKCLLDREKRLSGSGSKVKIIQRWNGVRAHISREFIEDFRTYLEQKIVDQELQQQEKQNKSFTLLNSNSILLFEWIENSLLIPIERPRRICVDLIFVPYFILVKKLSPEETTQKITEWLDKCNSLRPLDFDPNYKIKKAIETTNKTQIPPMKKNTLKDNYSNLYQILKDRGAIT